MAYKIESFDIEVFKRQLFEFSPDSKIIIFRSIKLKEVIKLFWWCIKYRPKVLIVENTYVASIIGVLKLGFVDKILYMPGDWLLNKLFPYFDWLACKWADCVWDMTEEIRNAREKRWRKNICKKEFVALYPIENKFIKNENIESVCFFGKERPDSGLELVPPFHLVKVPFIERNEMPEYFKNCACGINLITSEGSYTTKTIPSKVMDYLQHGLPVIVTKNCGYITKIIKQWGLGMVINPDKKEFFDAVKTIYDNHYNYREKIKLYIKSQKVPTIKEIINGMEK